MIMKSIKPTAQQPA